MATIDAYKDSQLIYRFDCILILVTSVLIDSIKVFTLG